MENNQKWLIPVGLGVVLAVVVWKLKTPKARNAADTPEQIFPWGWGSFQKANEGTLTPNIPVTPPTHPVIDPVESPILPSPDSRGGVPVESPTLPFFAPGRPGLIADPVEAKPAPVYSSLSMADFKASIPAPRMLTNKLLAVNPPIVILKKKKGRT